MGEKPLNEEPGLLTTPETRMLGPRFSEVFEKNRDGNRAALAMTFVIK